jgi:hypothetical protein
MTTKKKVQISGCSIGGTKDNAGRKQVSVQGDSQGTSHDHMVVEDRVGERTTTVRE